jgi:hypothetical protein
MQQTQQGIVAHVSAVIDISDSDPQLGAKWKMRRQVQVDSRHALPRPLAKIR